MSEAIYVWDRFIRFFHWSLVLLFVTSYVTGEEEHWIHAYSGYGILGLLALRIVWGFIGTRYARFSDFVRSPREVMGYLKALLSGQKPKHYVGHDPAGGIMVLAMLVALSCVGFSGLKLYAIEEGKGPLANASEIVLVAEVYADDDEHDESGRLGHEVDEYEDSHDREEEEEDFWEDLHEASVNFMILLVILHIAGVFLSSRVHGESLVRAMVTGRKERV